MFVVNLINLNHSFIKITRNQINLNIHFYIYYVVELIQQKTNQNTQSYTVCENGVLNHK